jgi:hypothetical protein
MAMVFSDAGQETSVACSVMAKLGGLNSIMGIGYPQLLYQQELWIARVDISHLIQKNKHTMLSSFILEVSGWSSSG